MAKINLARKSGRKWMVQATVFGSFAVHRAVPIDEVKPAHGTWAVTHVPTGISVSGFAAELDREDAERVARALADCGEFDSRELERVEDARWIFEAVVGAALETPS